MCIYVKDIFNSFPELNNFSILRYKNALSKRVNIQYRDHKINCAEQNLRFKHLAGPPSNTGRGQRIGEDNYQKWRRNSSSTKLLLLPSF